MTRRVKTESVEAKEIINKLCGLGYTPEQIQLALSKYKVEKTVENKILEKVK